MGPNQRSAQDQAATELLAELLNQSTRQTKFLSELRGLSLNSVLYSGTVTLDANGRATISSSTTYASFGVWALEDAVTVTEGTGADAPTAGVGVFPVPAGGALVWPMVGHELALYGTAGDRVIVALWSVPQCPMVSGGGGGLDGGGA